MAEFCTSLRLIFSDKPTYIHFTEFCPFTCNVFSAIISYILHVREPIKIIRATCLELPFVKIATFSLACYWFMTVSTPQSWAILQFHGRVLYFSVLNPPLILTIYINVDVVKKDRTAERQPIH